MAREVRVAILGDSRDFRRAVRDVQQDAGKMNRALSGMKKMAIGLGGAFAAREIVEFGGELIDAAEESQKVTRQTEAVIKSMGNAANVSAGQVADLSESLSMKAGIDDELIQSGQNLLLTFRNIRNEVGKGNDIFDQATAAALDVSVALGKDMTSSATLVGKALNDPIAGLTALSRAGVQFTDQQKEQIRAMVAVGDIAGAQKIILAELSSQFAGSAEAQATASAKLSVAWDNIKETLGEKLLPVVERFSLWLADNLPTAMAKAEAAGKRVTDWMRNNEGLVKAFVFLVGVGLVTAMLAYAASAAAAAVATIAATWPILAVVAAFALLGAGLLWVKSRWNDTSSVVYKFHVAVERTVGAVQTIYRWIRNLIDAVGDLAGKVGSVLGPLGRVISLGGKLGSIGGAAAGLAGKVGGVLGKIPGFASGGVMPGQRGVHSLAWVAGGETVLPTHRSGFGSGGGRPQVIQLVVSGQVLAEVVAEANRLHGRNEGR